MNYFILFFAILQFIAFFDNIQGDDPVYVRHIEWIMNISANQTRRFIRDHFEVPSIKFNPGMALWPFYQSPLSQMNESMSS